EHEVVRVAVLEDPQREAGAVHDEHAEHDEYTGRGHDHVVRAADAHARGMSGDCHHFASAAGAISRTSRRNSSPRSSKLLYASKLVHAGDSSTTSPGVAISRACCTASDSVATRTRTGRSSGATNAAFASTAASSSAPSAPKKTMPWHRGSA